jgi:hypothetical protein
MSQSCANGTLPILKPGAEPSGRVSQGHDPASFNLGVRACIAWLHREADLMNDPHARQILNSAAHGLGCDKASGAIANDRRPAGKED